MKKAICILFSMLMAFSVLGMTASAVATPLEAGSSMASAAQIPNFGVDYVSSLDVAGEEDWFKFTTLSEDAYYFVDSKNYNISNKGVIGTSSNVALHVHLYDQYNQELRTSWGDANNSFSLKANLEKGQKYYIKVYHANNATGNYEFSVTTDALTPAKTLQSISVLNLPNKTTYAYGESFNSAGLVVRALYSDNSSADVTG